MRRTAILLAATALPLAGCHLAQTAAHNLVNEPIEYLDQRKVTKQLREDAAVALAELEMRRGKGACAGDFADGFIDGYADYLERGGNAVPPAVPPLRYRRGKYLNPDGHARIHDYFAGFQAGADVAAQSGKRQFLTVPVLIPEPTPEPAVNVRLVPAEQCDPNRSAVPPQRVGEQLPPPRGMDPATGLPAPVRPPADPIPKLDLPKIDPPKPDGPKADPPKPPDAPLPAIPVPKPDVPKLMPDAPGRSPASFLDPPLPDPDTHPGLGRIVVPPLPDLPHKPGLPN